MDQAANHHLRRGVLRPHEPHDARALGFRHGVRHLRYLTVPNLGAKRASGTTVSHGQEKRLSAERRKNMDHATASRIKADFEAWSGGSPPDSEDEIFLYVEFARDSELDADE